MKRFVWSRLILIAASAASSFYALPALACDRSPDLVPIPGATDAEHEARYKAYEQARNVMWALELENNAVANSWRVYLGTVESISRNTPTSANSTISIKPVWQVRGLLPTKSATLGEEPRTSCPFPGDLLAPKQGDLVVVFEKPGSTTAWRAEEVRSAELIDAISMYALSLEKVR
jgi:hypothetical protein